MNTRRSSQSTTTMKHLSPREQQALLTARGEHGKDAPRRKRARGRRPGRTVAIAFLCAGLAAATVAPLRAADTSAPALFNQANAAQRAGRLGPAILGYERARFLAPGDKAITRNLDFAREKAGVAAPAVPAWQRPAHWLGMNALAGLASISLLLFCLLFFGTRFIPVTLRGLARVTGASLSAVSLVAAGAVAARWPELDRAVIVAAAPAAAHIAPAASASVPFELKPGELVRAEDHFGSFTRIRTAGGQSGWISTSEVEKIIPAAS